MSPTSVSRLTLPVVLVNREVVLEAHTVVEVVVVMAVMVVAAAVMVAVAVVVVAAVVAVVVVAAVVVAIAPVVDPAARTGAVAASVADRGPGPSPVPDHIALGPARDRDPGPARSPIVNLRSFRRSLPTVFLQYIAARQAPLIS